MSEIPAKPYVIIDVETTTRCPVGSFTANPMYDGNHVVAWGSLGGYRETTYTYDTTKFSPETWAQAYIDALSNKNFDFVFVGQNIKFDLLYLLKHIEKVKGLAEAIRVANTLPPIWDTQLAEYLLTGQTHLYASLNELVTNYEVGVLKNDEVSDMFKAGKGADEVPMELLLPYLKDDLENTEKVFLKQLESAKAGGMLPLIRTQMDALRATIVMNFHGMKVDLPYCEEQSEILEKEIKSRETFFQDKVRYLKTNGRLPDREFKIGSPKDVSMIMFGGVEKKKKKVPVGEYKNGKPKYTTVTEEVFYKGFGCDTTGATTNKLGYYPTDDKVLTELSTVRSSLMSQIAFCILKHREAHKQKETYYDNIRNLSMYSYVYPQLHHANTKTGRLSCSNPNLQNQTTDGGIKKAFVSRFDKGALVEIDYSQLEMIALAFLSGDEQLKKDLLDGVDMHSELYKEMYGHYPTKDERKPFKRLSFGLVYGAGYKTLAENAGCSSAEAKKFIDVFYTRYEGVKRYHEQLVVDARSNRVYTGDSEPTTGLPVGKYYHKSPTGRFYVFKEYVNEIPAWKKAKAGSGYAKKTHEASFSPPELKNWPVQGFATGDVVPMMVGVLRNELAEHPRYHDKVLPIMTVHDSILLDVDVLGLDGEIAEATRFCVDIMESAPKVLKAVFGIDFDIPLKVEASAGTNWLDQSPILT